MKTQDLNTNTEYIIIPSWTTVGKDERDPNKINERYLIGNKAFKGTLVSLTKYRYVIFYSEDQMDSRFEVADKGERSVGYLVTATRNGKVIYWVSRPQDIVGEAAEIEKRWESERQAKLEIENAKVLKEKEEEARREKEVAYIKQISEPARNSLEQLLRRKLREYETRLDSNWIGGDVQRREFSSIVTLSLRDLEALVELVGQLQEEVA